MPILPHRAANPKYGTGLVMISTFGDTRDLMIVNELKLPVRIIIDEGGRIKTGRYAGLNVREARERIIADLKKDGLLIKQERLVHNVPVCWRCKTPIEIIVTRELFVKQVELKEKLIELAAKMEFKPPEYRQVLIDWIKSLELDWPVSRRRYYATEIPLWWCVKRDGSKMPIVPKGGGTTGLGSTSRQRKLKTLVSTAKFKAILGCLTLGLTPLYLGCMHQALQRDLMYSTKSIRIL